MRAAVVAGAVSLALATSASAAPLSPSAQFAYNVAAAQWGGTGCAVVDAQVVPASLPGVVATYSAPGEPCFVYVSRDVAAPLAFAKVCKALVYIVGTWHGRTIGTERVPRVCLAKSLFLLNHPGYLGRRFR